MKLPFFEFHTDENLGLLELIRAQANNDAPAISCQDRVVSYRELNRISDTIASYLQDNGIEKGDMVAVDMARSERYPCAIYGILKTGGCCVPMEHTWPDARKQSVCSTANPKMVITEDTYAAIMENGYREQTRIIRCMPNDPMVMLFTSGSSGVPKGINVTYSVWNVSYDMICYRSLSEDNQGDGALQGKQLIIGSFSTTPGTIAVLTTTAAGRHICIATEYEIETPESIARAILDYNIGMIAFTPAFLRAALQDDIFRKAVQKLRYILFSGGVLTQELCNQLHECNPDILTWNIYGMSEVSCITAGYIRDDIRNVGKPAPNTLVAILDENGQDVGVNEPGEICVGTKKITTSYMNAPALNRQKHFLHPEYGPLFRTGDLGRGDEEGNLYHLGRIDRMVKIRDVRIELDEIEQTISAFPGVKQGLAAAHGPAEDRFIVGYYQSEEPLDERELRRHILSTLPQSYMPRFLMQIEHIPMTETGKVAYPRLPVPEAGESIAYEAPETEQEHCLSRVLAKVLKMPSEKISMDAGFAQLGGDSIRGMIACSRLREQGWLLQPNTLYNEPTLRQVARQLKAASEIKSDHIDCAARSIPETDLQHIVQTLGGEDKVEAILNLSFESRSIYERLRQKGAMPSNITTLIPVDRGIDEEQFRQRVQAVVRCHPTLRSRIVENDLGAAYQVVLREKAPSCYYRDLRYLADGTELPNEKQRAFCTMYMNFYNATSRTSEEALTPHFVCFRFGEELSGIGCSCSHAFLDGWSNGILLAELAGADDPTAKDSYIDYIKFHSSKSKSEDLRFWREYLKGVEIGQQLLPMKSEWEEGGIQTRRIFLDGELSRRLEQYGKEKHISPTVILQYLTGQIICEVVDRTEIVMKVFFAARGADVPREDRIIGNLARLYPVRYKAGQSLAHFHADLRLAEQHMAPTIGEIFAAAGLWVRPVLLTFTTNDLPGSEKLRKDKLFLSPSTNISADTLDAAVICTPGSFGAQFVYNPLIFPEEKMGHAESRLRELAQQLLQEV